MENNPFVNALKQLEEAAALIADQYKDKERFHRIIDKLKTPDRVVEETIEVEMDDSSKRQFQVYRSQHNAARGPYKGGIRFHQNVSLDEVRALSMWMTWKCAITGIPYGGGKGGVVVDPSELSVAELERLSRAYARTIAPYIGAWKDIPAPDVNTTGQIMAWMLDEYEALQGFHAPATFTGKPLELGGSLGREEATGRGGVYILKKLVEKLSLEPASTTIAIQGLGNVGYWFAYFASEEGFKIVGVSDSKGGIYSAKGLNFKAVMKHKKKTGTVKGFEGAKNITNEKLLQLPVDVLVPAALENSIQASNAKQIQAKVVIEMANGPVTPEADRVLWKKKILSVPDVLSNAGGVTVSYFEWVQNLYGYTWTKEEVNQKLQPLMEQAFDRMWTMHEEKKLPLRMAAYVNALKLVVDAMFARGR